MAMETLCAIELDCDVEVAEHPHSRAYAIKVRGCSQWAENFRDAKEALAALIAVRESGLNVPAHVTQSIAKKIVQRTFNSGAL